MVATSALARNQKRCLRRVLDVEASDLAYITGRYAKDAAHVSRTEAVIPVLGAIFLFIETDLFGWEEARRVARAVEPLLVPRYDF
jgi:hypothetical protein